MLTQGLPGPLGPGGKEALLIGLARPLTSTWQVLWLDRNGRYARRSTVIR